MIETLGNMDDRYRHILESCEPYLVTYPGNLDALHLSPFGLPIPTNRLYNPTRLESREVIDGLHQLDRFSFGDQEMLMPRWVLFDCGEFPGIVFGFGKKAALLEDDVRDAYQVTGPEYDESFVPLSMWVALACAEPNAWFGHNLSSANLVARTAPLPGLATITKAYGIAVTQATRQYGATQWSSSSLNIHLSLGTLQLLCAYTPAHTHPETFAYRIDVDEEALTAPLRQGFSRPQDGGDRLIEDNDSQAIRELHDDIENGARYSLYRTETQTDPHRLWLKAL
jgi:hypothetical protein